MNRLKEMRKKNKVTQDDVALFLNIQRASYTNIENGKREPDIETMKKIAKYFNTTVSYLINETNDPSPPSVTPDPFEGLSEDSRKHIEETIRLLKLKERYQDETELSKELTPKRT